MEDKPKNTKPTIITLLILGLVGLLCFCIVMFSVISNLFKSSKSPLTSSAAYTPTPTASPLLYDELMDTVENKRDMTDLQFEDYLNGVIGTRIRMEGIIIDVKKDGEILLDTQRSGFFDSIFLQGVPSDITKNLNKGENIIFEAAIKEFNAILGTSLYLDNPVIIEISPAQKIEPESQSTTIPTNSPDFLPTETQTTENDIGLLPGLQPAEVRLNLEDRQFTCDLVYSPDDTDPYFKWECIQENIDNYIIVEIWSRSLTTVDLIQVGIMQFGEPDNSFAIDFLGFMATMPYDEAEPDQARNWVAETLPTITESGDVRETTFGNVKFQLFGIPTARFLDIGDDLPFP